jgi:excisionase family DNA binding protein
VAEPSDFLTIPEAAETIGMSPRRLQQLVAAGQVRETRRFGRTTVLPRSEVDRLTREGWPGRRQKPAKP